MKYRFVRAQDTYELRICDIKLRSAKHPHTIHKGAWGAMREAYLDHRARDHRYPQGYRLIRSGQTIAREPAQMGYHQEIYLLPSLMVVFKDLELLGCHDTDASRVRI